MVEKFYLETQKSVLGRSISHYLLEWTFFLISYATKYLSSLNGYICLVISCEDFTLRHTKSYKMEGMQLVPLNYAINANPVGQSRCFGNHRIPKYKMPYFLP